MNQAVRKRRFVHVPIQGALIGRLAAQWIVFLSSVLVISLLMQLLLDPLQDSESRVRNLKITMIAFAIATAGLLPAFMWDLTKFSHRFVGPILRLRSHLAGLDINREGLPLAFREDDYWQELATDFNESMSRMRRQHSQELVAAMEGRDEADAEVAAIS